MNIYLIKYVHSEKEWKHTLPETLFRAAMNTHNNTTTVNVIQTKRTQLGAPFYTNVPVFFKTIFFMTKLHITCFQKHYTWFAYGIELAYGFIHNLYSRLQFMLLNLESITFIVFKLCAFLQRSNFGIFQQFFHHNFWLKWNFWILMV